MEIKFSGDDSDAYVGAFRALKDYAIEITYWKNSRNGAPELVVNEPVFVRFADVNGIEVQGWNTKTGDAFGDVRVIDFSNINDVEVF